MSTIVQKDYSAGQSLCRLVSLAVSSLSPAKVAMVSGNSAGSTYSRCSVPEVESKLVLAGISLASLCCRPSRVVPFSLVHVFLSSGCSPGWAFFSPSLRVTGGMSLMGCVTGAVRSPRQYLRCLLFNMETAGHRPASHTTTLTRVHWSMSVIGLPRQLTSY